MRHTKFGSQEQFYTARAAIRRKVTAPSTIAASLALATVSALGLRNISTVREHISSLTVAGFIGTFASAMAGFAIYTALTEVFQVVADKPIQTISSLGQQVIGTEDPDDHKDPIRVLDTGVDSFLPPHVPVVDGGRPLSQRSLAAMIDMDAARGRFMIS